MSKFLRSLTDGSLRCRYCGDNVCNCMEDGFTVIKIIAIWQYGEDKSKWLVQLAKQVLPNGKKIPSGYKVWIPQKDRKDCDELLKTMTVSNDFLNKLRFD